MSTDNVQKLVLIKPINEATPEQSSYAPRPVGLQGKRIELIKQLLPQLRPHEFLVVERDTGRMSITKVAA